MTFKKIKSGKSQSGSALMTVLVVVSIMTIVSLSGSKILMMQFENIRNFASSRAAFYLAESGIEQGLYDFRRDRREEKSDQKISLGAIDGKNFDFNYSSIFWVNEVADVNVGQDNVWDQEVSTGELQNLQYKWAWLAGVNNDNRRAQILHYTDSGEAISGAVVVAAPAPSAFQSIPFDTQTKKFRFLMFGAGIKDFNLKCSVTTSKCLADTQNTITSKASYGGISRKLEVKVDRQTGALISLFDYTLYSVGEIK
ncbi:MAG: hypothetical protein CEN89_221 [Candidatus Berkelbacteria bacterium Licking1014_7]|uniref:Type 4 fimbrial biogenesis protein PilX N-terminal domain-containing protein n=1 Tax=Candidatus Berkelbacteria bacterium Licking1014_7 TaxID=2017147 RepID=A0A554LK21_9BACT|nr:MAG: hypothetical protein CEN89_221 [Candidatus Berkelbacteria bacterium Licking1014_7]